MSERTDTIWTVTEQGMNIVNDGSPEYLVYCSVPAGTEGITMTDLIAVAGDECKLGLGPCIKKKWLKKQGDIITKDTEDATDDENCPDCVKNTFQLQLLDQDFYENSVNQKELGLLKKRKLIYI